MINLKMLFDILRPNRLSQLDRKPDDFSLGKQRARDRRLIGLIPAHDHAQ
jgi:hypothetical protein